MRIVRSERKRGVLVNQRVRTGQRNLQLPYLPPEDWHEPTEKQTGKFKVVVREPGKGYRHVLTAEDVRNRLAQLPRHFLDNLEVVQFSQMTRKKSGFPCYGMQWGGTLYLYPIEQSLVEEYECAPTPAQRIEARMYGGEWTQIATNKWQLTWTEEGIRDFYLNNILIHELGHLVDTRNTKYHDREKYAEWFAIEYGYRATSRPGKVRKSHVQRHG